MTMASLVYDSFTDDVMNGAIVPASDTFYGLLVTNSYTPNKGTDAKRSDANANEITGTGYTAGGAAATATVAKDTTGHKETISFANVVWSGASFTARGIVIYKHRGGLATADNLVACGTFGADVTASSSTFTAVNSTPITYQN